MMGKLIRQKQICMNQIKTIVHISEVPKYKKVQLNVISYEEYEAKKGGSLSDNNNQDGNNNDNNDYDYIPRPNNIITNWIHNKTAEMKCISTNN